MRDKKIDVKEDLNLGLVNLVVKDEKIEKIRKSRTPKDLKGLKEDLKEEVKESTIQSKPLHNDIEKLKQLLRYVFYFALLDSGLTIINVIVFILNSFFNR